MRNSPVNGQLSTVNGQLLAADRKRLLHATCELTPNC